jgi:uncharacterized RDD family membrane protein YckC
MPEAQFRTFWRRLGAGLIDGLVVLSVEYVYDEVYPWGESDLSGFVGGVIFGLCSFGYTVVLHWKYGKTIGKMITRVTVLRNDTEAKINFRMALVRDSPWIAIAVATWVLIAVALFSESAHETVRVLGGIVGWSSFGWFALEVISMLTNEKRRAIHDYIAGTVVVRDP